MKLLMLIIAAFTISNNVFSQNFEENAKTIKEGLTSDELALAKDLYIKMMETQAYIDLKNNIDLLVEKTNAKDQKFTSDQEYEDWIKLNLFQTKFKNISEALQLIEQGKVLIKKRSDENKLLFKMIGKSTPSQFHEILEPERINRPF